MPKVVGIKLTDTDYAEWSARAQKEGVKLTTWIRAKVVQGTWSNDEKSSKVVLELHDAANKQKVNPPKPKVNPVTQPVTLKPHHPRCSCLICKPPKA